MVYTIHTVAQLSKVSVRTLHYYDEIGLLQPSRRHSNGYRQYEQKDLMRLQQILFFRELGVPLKQIKNIVDNPAYSADQVLAEQQHLLELEKNRIEQMLKTIKRTLHSMQKGVVMKDTKLYDGLDRENIEKYLEEAKERWGSQDVSSLQGKMDNWNPQTKAKASALQEEVLSGLVEHMAQGPESPEIQQLIAKHYEWVNLHWDCNLEAFSNMANMYVEDERFAAFYAKLHPDMPAFLKKAMLYFCATKAK